MNQAHIALCLGLVASAVACFSASSSGGGADAPDAAGGGGEDSGLLDTSIAPVEAGYGHDATSAADTGSALDAGVDAVGPGQCGDGAVCPINELTLTPLYPGLKLTWQEGQPCDTVVGEKEWGLNSYPSQQEPPGLPLFTVPGSTLEYSDPTATEGNQIVFHTRCVVGGVTSVWSNELASFGTTADAGDGGDAGP